MCKDSLDIDFIAREYEKTLATIDKEKKKKNGIYYTPLDVSLLMSSLLLSLKGEAVCDVGSGIGSLIFSYLELIGEDKARVLINEGKVYLYDIDARALDICKSIFIKKYGKEFTKNVNFICANFLDSDITLPKDCKVISNPPYAAIKNINKLSDKNEVLMSTRELYSVFMEKIIKQSLSCVLITPYSFISGDKFYSLRKVMSNCSGAIYSFDNVPANIFCGKKEGVFNTNTTNAVRAAITVISDKENKGFLLTPLIRFKSIERENLLKVNSLNLLLGSKRQKITSKNSAFIKCDKSLEEVYLLWRQMAGEDKIGDLVCNEGEYKLYIPNTCRYFTVAVKRKLNRRGQIVLSFNDKKKCDFVFCLINSSFAYWWWRLLDGGITYTQRLLKSCPSVFNISKNEDNLFFETIANKMTEESENCIVTKNNVGVQENIKYPAEYKDKINDRILKIIGANERSRAFDIIHSNMITKVSL